MAYLPNYRYDIFISYAHVDNRRDDERWVDQFSKSLKSCLAEQLGRDEAVAVWRDERLSGNEILDSSIIEACRNSAILICITSPGYMKSEWCQKEYEAFCSANQGQHPPTHGNSSRLFNVRLREPSSEEHKANFEKRFGRSLGYAFYDRNSGSILWPKPANAPDARYRNMVEKLASEIRALLENMRGKIMGDEQPGLNRLDINPADLYRCSLNEVLQQAKQRLIISAHTLNKFSHDPDMLYTLQLLLRNKVKVTMIMLNPNSKYAEAHRPYHDLESKVKTAINQHRESLESLAKDQCDKSLEFLRGVFGLLDDKLKPNFEVLLSNYMPRFRTILVDDKRAYLYFYMYGEDLTDHPDYVLERTRQVSSARSSTENKVFKRVLDSTKKLTTAPEIIPYIRYGRIYEYWDKGKLAKWESWPHKVRERHKSIHRYYVEKAADFDREYGEKLEDYVTDHLDLLVGRALVLGCGSGKEVRHLAKGKKCSDLYGIDFSPKAIDIAINKKQKDYPNLNAQFIVADFYDLDHIPEGKFDSIIANAALVHLFEPDDMSTMLECIWRKLNPGGFCFIRTLYKENEHGHPLSYDDPDAERNDGRWFVYFSYTDLAKLAIKAGFSVREDLTKKIVKKCGLGELKVVMSKGFRHFNPERKTVRWPTILLEKPR